MENTQVRPTKKQRELLTFIEAFITQHGYSPSYREIMSGLGYNSIATVAVHVNNLISRGHLQKRGKSARSLEVVSGQAEPKFVTNQVQAGEEKWLVDKVEYFFRQAETNPQPNQGQLDGLFVLIGALKILGLSSAAQAFLARYNALKNQVKQ